MSGAEPTALAEPPVTPTPVSPEPPAPGHVTPAGSAAHDKAIVHGVLWQGSLRWLSQVLSWSATIIIARRLSPQDYGMVGTATILVTMLSIATENGLGRALVMRRERTQEVVEQVHGASILIGAGLMMLMLLSAYPLGLFYAEPRVVPLIAVLSSVMLLNGVNAVPIAVLQQRLEYRNLAVIEFSKAIAQAVVVLLGALLGYGPWSLIAGLLAGNAVAAVLLQRWVQLAIRRPTWGSVMPTASYAKHLMLASLAWYIYSSADFAAVGRVAGLTALGYYQFAWNMAQLPGEKLANVLQTVVGPFFGAIGDDVKQLRHYFLLLSEFLVSLMLPVLTGFALVAPIAVPLIFGDKWLPAVPIMQLLVIAAGVGSVSMLSQHVLVARGRAKMSQQISVGAAVLMPIAFYVAARVAGPLAVASVWLIAQPILSAIPLLYVRRDVSLPLRAYVHNLRAPLISSGVMIASVLGMARLVASQPSLVQLLALILTGALIYPAVFYALYRDRIQAMVAIWKGRR